MPTATRSDSSSSMEGFTMIIGASRTAIVFEVGAVQSGTAPVIVHAMRAREKFLR